MKLLLNRMVMKNFSFETTSLLHCNNQHHMTILHTLQLKLSQSRKSGCLFFRIGQGDCPMNDSAEAEIVELYLHRDTRKEIAIVLHTIKTVCQDPFDIS
jgi:hypothetical protein